jgi:UDP-GlcNAc3NAcA epimerase
MKSLDLNGKEFVLCTIHRDLNTDDPARLNAIFSIINDLSREKAVNFIIPLHPRTAKMIPRYLEKELERDIRNNPYLKITDPISYFDTLLLESRCMMIMTDSGGVQKESYFFRKPCLVIRPETEWKELIDLGTAIIVDTNKELTRESFDHFLSNPRSGFPPIFGEGHSAEFIVNEIVNFLQTGLQE